jgi:hypothetical protein
MTAKIFFIQLLSVLLMLLIAGAGLAYFQFKGGYQFAEERFITRESSCGMLYGGGNIYWHYFEILGCKVQIEESREALKARLGIDSDSLTKRQLEQLMQQDKMLRYQQSRELRNLIDQCDGDIESCDTSSQYYGHHSAPSINDEAYSPLSAEECEEVDSSGFLPEC